MHRTRLSHSSVVTLLAAGLLAGCAEAPTADSWTVNLAKPGSEVQITVSSVSPTSAPQDTTLDIVVGGSNFDSSSEVALGVAGQPVAQIRTNSTRYVNPKQLVANITISGDAEAGTYDVIVMSKIRKGGIGTEMFEVKTTGQIINDKGELTVYDSPTVGGLFGDGRSATGTALANGTAVYSDGMCGVASEFFANREGDVTVDPVAARVNNKTCSSKAARYLTVNFSQRLSGRTISTNASGGHYINVRRVLDMSVGQSREQLFVIWFRKQSHTCEMLRFDALTTEGVTGRPAKVTRRSATEWEVESQPNAQGRHVGFCQTGGTGHPDTYYDPGTLLGAYDTPVKLRIRIK